MTEKVIYDPAGRRLMRKLSDLQAAYFTYNKRIKQLERRITIARSRINEFEQMLKDLSFEMEHYLQYVVPNKKRRGKKWMELKN